MGNKHSINNCNIKLDRDYALSLVTDLNRYNKALIVFDMQNTDYCINYGKQYYYNLVHDYHISNLRMKIVKYKSNECLQSYIIKIYYYMVQDSEDDLSEDDNIMNHIVKHNGELLCEY